MDLPTKTLAQPELGLISWITFEAATGAAQRGVVEPNHIWELYCVLAGFWFLLYFYCGSSQLSGILCDSFKWFFVFNLSEISIYAAKPSS